MTVKTKQAKPESVKSSKISSLSSPSISKTNKFLDYIWPIERHELPKFLLITLLMFCILGIQNLVRAMKDSVINTMIGTETIAFLKFWGVLPAAFLVAIIYVKLINVMKSENIFYLIMSTFLGFFALFAFYLFPNYEYLHLNQDTMNQLVLDYPNFKWFILLLSNWSFSLFYVIAELWPNAVFALLFWQFVNNITQVEESKRFYPIFALLGQTGLALSGFFLTNLRSVNNYFINTFNLQSDESVVTIQIVISVILVLGFIALTAFWLINHRVLDLQTVENLKFQVKKQKITLKDSITMVVQSRYIRLIAILLVCYGMAINLVEGPWKKEVAMVYQNPTEFAMFIGSYLSYTGVLTILFVIIGSNVVRSMGWLSAAVITPVMMLITGLMFFLASNFDPVAASMMVIFALTDPMMVAIAIGAIQNVITKSSKYTLFDSTKEMSYVPLSVELKTRGKAAADMIGIKLGKSSSALIQSLIFIVFPQATYNSISVYLMVVFTIICCIWLWAVIELNKEYKEACESAVE